jgi:hypothetical protein
MSPFVTRLSLLTVCAVALTTVPAMTPAMAGQKHATKHVHMKHAYLKQHRTYGRRLGAAWAVGPERPSAGYYPPSEPVCPGIGRSFDCKIWPPPFADDPDRKTSRF